MRDVVTSALLVVFFGVMLMAAAALVNPGYDLLGPAFFPKVVLVVLIVLCLALFTTKLPSVIAGHRAGGRRNDRAGARAAMARQTVLVALLIAYASVLIQGWANFEVASVVYMLATGLLLVPLRLKSIGVLVITVLLSVAATSYVFRKLLVVNLP